MAPNSPELLFTSRATVSLEIACDGQPYIHLNQQLDNSLGSFVINQNGLTLHSTQFSALMVQLTAIENYFKTLNTSNHLILDQSLPAERGQQVTSTKSKKT